MMKSYPELTRMTQGFKSLKDELRGLRDLGVCAAHLEARHDHPLQSQGGKKPQGGGLVVVAEDSGVSEGVTEDEAGHPRTASGRLCILLT